MATPAKTPINIRAISKGHPSLSPHAFTIHTQICYTVSTNYHAISKGDG